LTPEQKLMERQIEFVQYSLYALSMSCLVLVFVLEYYKIASNRSGLAIIVGLGVFGSVGFRALNKLKESVLASNAAGTKTTEVLIEGTKP